MRPPADGNLLARNARCGRLAEGRVSGLVGTARHAGHEAGDEDDAGRPPQGSYGAGVAGEPGGGRPHPD